MNTDKLIPIDFSRNITPFVPGDNYHSPFLGRDDCTMSERDVQMFNRGEFDNCGYFVTSFANRPNTGIQPVGDDVIVDIVVATDSRKRDPRKADYWNWNPDVVFPIETWKPNHAATLKQWQAEQLTHEPTKAEIEAERPQELNEEYLKGCSHSHLLMFSIDMLAQTKYQQGVIDELSIKPPLVNWDGKQSFDFGMVYIDGGGTKCEFIGLHAGIIIGRPVIELGIPMRNKHYLSTSDKSFCKPIQTAEEKLRGHLWYAINGNESKESNIDAIISDLMASLEFTITLNDKG